MFAVVVASLLPVSLLLLVIGGPSDLPPPASATPVVERDGGRAAAPIATSTGSRTRPTDEASADDPPIRASLTALSGTVRDDGNQPISAVTVAVELVDQMGRRRATHAQHGNYTLPDLEVGTHWVTARAAGYRSLKTKIELRPGQSAWRRDFTLQPAVALRVRVTTAAGGTVPEAFATESAVRNHRLVAIATREPIAGRLAPPRDIGAIGTFVSRGEPSTDLPADCLGVMLLDDDLPACVHLVRGDIVLQSQRVSRGQLEVDFIIAPEDCLLDLCSLRAQVVNAATGLPIQGARMLVRNAARSDAGVATDDRGIAMVEGHEAGRFDVHIWAHEHASLRLSLDLLPGRTMDLGTLQLESEVIVAGRVVGVDDRPLAASFSLGVVSTVDNSIHWLPHEPWQSSGNGTFTLRGLRRGHYAIRTSNHDALRHRAWEGTPWVSGIVLVDTRAGSRTDLEVHLRPATRVVLCTTAVEPAGLRFRIVDEQGFELVADRLVDAAPRPLHVPPGSYRIALLDAQGEILTQQAKMVGTSTEQLELVYPKVR